MIIDYFQMKLFGKSASFGLALLTVAAYSVRLQEPARTGDDSKQIADSLQMLEGILSQFTASIERLLPGLEGDKDVIEDPQLVSRSFIGSREVTIGDARMFIFGDFVGR